MAFGQWEDFAPLPTPPGAPPAYSFVKRGGERMTMMGEPAERLRANIEASRSLAPQPVAGPGGAPDVGQRVDEVLAKYSAPPAAAPGDIPGMAGPAGPAGAAQPAQDTVPASIARPTGEGGAGGGGPPGNRTPGYGLIVGPGGKLGYTTGGTAKITSEDIEAEAAARRPIQTGQTITTIEGIPQSREFIEGMDAVRQQEMVNLETSRQVAQKKAQIETDIANEAQVRVAAQLKEAQAQQNEIAARVARDDQVAQQAKQAYAGAKVDPSRMFKGEGSAAVSIVSALAAGLGAFGATLGRTENFAQNTINAAINRDVAAQEAEIAIKGNAAQNALADLNRSTGSLEQAKLLLRQIQTNWAMAQAESMRSAAKSPQIDAAYATIATDLQKRWTIDDEIRRKESMDRNTSDVTFQFKSPQAGSAGGVVWYDPKTAIQVAQSVQNLGKGEAELQQTNAQTAKTISEVGQGKGKGGKVGAIAARAQADVDAGAQAMDDIAEAAGGIWNPETQEYDGDVGGVLRTGYAATDRSQKIGAAVRSAAAGIGRALEGNAPNESTMQDFKEGITAWSGDQLKANLTAYRRRIEERRRALQQNPNALDADYADDKGKSQ